MEEISINAPEQHGGLTHHTTIRQRPNTTAIPANAQALRSLQDHTHHGFGTKGHGEVRIQDRDLAGEGALRCAYYQPLAPALGRPGDTGAAVTVKLPATKIAQGLAW